MNEKLPFEDAFERQMNEMQTPLENESWQKMKALLEERKKRRPFSFLRLYQILGFALLIILISTGIIIYYRNTAEKAVTGLNNKSTAPGAKPLKTQEIKQIPDTANNLNTFSNKDRNTAFTNKKNVAGNIKKNDETRVAANKSQKNTTRLTAISGKSGTPIKVDNKLNTALNSINIQKSIIVNDRFKNKQANKKVLQAKHEFDLAGSNISQPNKITINKKILLLQRAGKIKVNKDLEKTASEKKELHTGINGIQSGEDPPGSVRRELGTVSNIQIPKELKPGTMALFRMLTSPPSIRLWDSVTSIANAVNQKRINSRSGKFFIAAGLGIQQQVPVSGQKAAGYNHNGNKNIVTDYIPSIYIRLEKNRHWFLQGEFSYAAPRLVKPLSYQQQTIQNFSAGAYTIHSTSLKKTFYNKVPVSFNYYISPHLSLGIGAVYSWLHSAVAEHQTLTKDVSTQQQTITSRLVSMKGFRDSFLYRSHTNLLLQANYSVKRFSFGLGFTKDVRPYIKYTLPDGTVFKEKNWSLDFALRFRLYQSRNFSLLNKRINKSLKAR